LILRIFEKAIKNFFGGGVLVALFHVLHTPFFGVFGLTEPKTRGLIKGKNGLMQRVCVQGCDETLEKYERPLDKMYIYASVYIGANVHLSKVVTFSSFWG
jgi:hypothetical protein